MKILPREPALSASDLLLEELSHRINNEFASVISAISRAAARSKNEDVKAALAAVSDGLMAYALVHRILQMPAQNTEVDASAYMRRLCEAISQSKLADKGIRLIFVERPLKMDSVRCWRLGLIVSELITNAVRHGLHGIEGEIRVELLPSRLFVECLVSDNGHAVEPIRPGRGLRIVEALARILGGKIDYVIGERGSTAILIFPESTQSHSLQAG